MNIYNYMYFKIIEYNKEFKHIELLIKEYNDEIENDIINDINF